MTSLDHRTLQDYDYILINPLQVDAATWNDLPTVPVVPEPFKTQPHLFPVLLELGKLEFTARIGLLDRAETWARTNDTPWFSALLASAAPADRLRMHLGRRMALHQREGHDNYFRFHDPRTFQHLHWILDAEQMDRLLGPVKAWAWQDSTGQLVSYVRNFEEDSVIPLKLSQEQQATLLRLGDINENLRRLARKAPQRLGDATLAQQVNKLLIEAWTEHRMSDPADRQLYVEQAIVFDLRIHQHPDMLVCVARAQSGELTYVGACAHLDTSAMQRMAEQMNQQKDRP